ncbi:MAG: WYL domain-containing protein [Calditrichaeota bacterium]|nr:WYL domain-containing protein [Candidatus Cloacimonadota bacterium]MCB1046539.1 WYL domain-containing protein [Calditrichota bacterium]
MAATHSLSRLMNLIPYLSRRQGQKVDLVCKELGLELKELLADIRMISALSYGNWGEGDLVDIYLDHDTIQVFTGGLFEHRLRFSQPEMAALLSGWDHLQALGLKRYLPGMESALRHLRDELSGGGGGDLEEISKRIRYQVGLSADEDLVPQVLSATEEHRSLEIQYYSVNSNSHRSRRVDPWHCVCRNGVWYLTGHDHASGEQRTFRLDRISELTVLDETFSVPDGFDPEQVMTPGHSWLQGAHMEVTIRLGGTLERIAREDNWKGLEEVDGQLRMSMGESNGNWVMKLLLPYCDECEILGPPELRARMAATLEELERLVAEDI